MSNLLSAGFSRYRKSLSFWVILAISLALGLMTGAAADSSTTLFGGIYMMGLLVAIAVQISLMLGTEFGNGIVRNKLAAGHGRGEIFLTELMLSLISSTLMFVLYYGAFFMFNLRRLERMEAGDIAAIVIGLWLMHLAFAAICTAVCFFIPYYPAMAAIINITLIIVMVIFAQSLRFKFDEPEFYHSYSYDENGYRVDNSTPNPKYISPDSAEYAVLHAAYYLMPCGQLNDYQYALSEFWFYENPDEKYLNDLKTAPWHSLVTIVLFSAAGFLYFRRKNLR